MIYKDKLKKIGEMLEAVHAGAAASAKDKNVEEGYHIWRDLAEGYEKLLFEVVQQKRRADIARSVYKVCKEKKLVCIK